MRGNALQEIFDNPAKNFTKRQQVVTRQSFNIVAGEQQFSFLSKLLVYTTISCLVTRCCQRPFCSASPKYRETCQCLARFLLVVIALFSVIGHTSFLLASSPAGKDFKPVLQHSSPCIFSIQPAHFSVNDLPV